MKKILILIPTPDSVDRKAEKALLAQDYPNFEILVYVQKRQNLHKDFEINRNMNIVNARNAMKNLAVKTDADYFMWLDSDIILPQGALTKLMLQLEQPAYDPRKWELLQERFSGKNIAPTKKHIVSAYYVHRKSFQYNASILIADNTLVGINVPTASLIRVDKIDFGCMIVSREVFEKINYKTGYHWKINELTGVCECMMFCNDAVELGYELYMCGDVICKHNWKGKNLWLLQTLPKLLMEKVIQSYKLKAPKRL